MNQPDFSIIVVNWNTRDLLRQCLASVYSEPAEVTLDVIVVDNGSSDDSQEMVRREFPAVRLVENEANVGFAAANNQAMRIALGRIFLLLNSDAYLLPGALDKLARFMDSAPQAAVVGPQVLNPDGTIQPSCFRFPTLLDIGFESFFLTRLFPRSDLFNRRNLGGFDRRSLREVDWVSGACLAVRREVAEEAGPMDEGFFMYAEEADWCLRIRESGHRIFFYPGAEGIHHGGQSAKHIRAEMLPRGFASRFRYFEKHYGRGYARAIRLLTVGGMLLRIVASLIAWPCIRSPEVASRIKGYANVVREILVHF